MADGAPGAVGRVRTRYLVLQGSAAAFALEAARVLRVQDPAEHDLAHARDLRHDLELSEELGDARVLSVEVQGALWYFVVSAPLSVLELGQGALVDLPALLRASGAGRFVSGALLDGERLISLVLDPARLVPSNDARRSTQSEEEGP